MKLSAVEREILRPLSKVHILHHASEAPIRGNWMLDELRGHGYNVSPGTLYPMLRRLCTLGWLKSAESASGRALLRLPIAPQFAPRQPWSRCVQPALSRAISTTVVITATIKGRST